MVPMDSMEMEEIPLDVESLETIAIENCRKRLKMSQNQNRRGVAQNQAVTGNVVENSNNVVASETSMKFTTDVPFEAFNISWDLKNFKAMVEMKDSMKSVKLNFEAGHTIGVPSKWCFFLRREDDELGLYLKIVESRSRDKEVFAKYDTTLKKLDGTNFLRLCTEITDMKSVADWGWSNIGTISTMVNPRGGILNNFGITIFIRFTIYARNTVNTGKTEMEVAALKNQARLSVTEDLMTLFNSGANADFTIRMGNKKEFRVHKLILSTRSPVFFGMFNTTMTESSSGNVVITDMSAESMEILLKFIYTGSLDGNWSSVIDEIVYASEKYNLPLLKEYCDKTLINACTFENAMDFLKLAKLHSLETATKNISDYIKINIPAILQTI